MWYMSNFKYIYVFSQLIYRPNPRVRGSFGSAHRKNSIPRFFFIILLSGFQTIELYIYIYSSIFSEAFPGEKYAKASARCAQLPPRETLQEGKNNKTREYYHHSYTHWNWLVFFCKIKRRRFFFCWFLIISFKSRAFPNKDFCSINVFIIF